MGRTRDAALAGAVRAVAKYGARKATMGDIAMLAGIAKATLYNHFRTREDVYDAVVAAEVEAIAAAAGEQIAGGFGAALSEAARLVAEHPAVRRVALDEPVLLARLATISEATPWKCARDHVAGALRASGCPDDAAAVDLVLRYLMSQLVSPSDTDQRRAEVRLIAAAVTGLASPPVESPLPAQPGAPLASGPAGSAGTSS